MSELVEVPLSSMTSGATAEANNLLVLQSPKAGVVKQYAILLQFGVPDIESSSSVALSLSFMFKDTPKSESFTSPVLVVKIFAAFKSQ